MILVDTGVWFEAAADRGTSGDQCRDLLAEHHRDLATTDAVLSELWTLMVARGRSHLALVTVQDVVSVAAVLPLTTVDRRRSVEILADWSDQDFSWSDALSFALMERTGIDTALSLDHHFRVFRQGHDRARRFRVLPGE